jgi:hypothetical protein
LAAMRQKTQGSVTAPPGSCIMLDAKENDMGTCPKCKLRIRKNGNHVKLGSVWVHKMCPPKPAAASAKRA